MTTWNAVASLLLFAVCLLGAADPGFAQTEARVQSANASDSAQAKASIGSWEGKTANYIVRVEIDDKTASVGLWNLANQFILYQGALAYKVDERGRLLFIKDDHFMQQRVYGTITPNADGTLALDINDMKGPDAGTSLVVSSFKCVLSRKLPAKK